MTQISISYEEYCELLEYKGKYEAMKEAYEKLLKEYAAIQYSYPRQTWTTSPWTYSSDTTTHPTMSSTRIYRDEK